MTRHVTLAGLTLAAGLALAALPAAADDGAAFPMPEGKLYLEECGGCHTAYAPGLLPARSWKKMMAELEHHFGEDATFGAEAEKAVSALLTELAADGRRANTLMRRIAGSIPAADAPQRISGTPFFKFMHDEVPNSFWKRTKIGTAANCVACHTRANLGRYYEREVSIPK